MKHLTDAERQSLVHLASFNPDRWLAGAVRVKSAPELVKFQRLGWLETRRGKVVDQYRLTEAGRIAAARQS